MRKLLLFVLTLVYGFGFFQPGFTAEDNGPVVLNEVWGYLMNGEEKYLEGAETITDIGYFSAKLGVDGKLTHVPEVGKIKNHGKRNHLVIAEASNKALLHFMLNPDLPFKNILLKDIKEKSADYDGIQIDFEAVSKNDRREFISFLYQLKHELKDKTLSIALPARNREVNDAYDYKTISRIADRVIIMAYDQHWSGTGPGPVASPEWCKRVSEFAIQKIKKDQIVMGIPFYGRSWESKNHTRAYRYSGISDIMKEHNLSPLHTPEGIPYLKYKTEIEVSVFFDNIQSIISKLNIYKKNSIHKVAFWRIGQEVPETWKYISVKK